MSIALNVNPGVSPLLKKKIKWINIKKKLIIIKD